MDRNILSTLIIGFLERVALRKESVDRNETPTPTLADWGKSPSARRAWIEMLKSAEDEAPEVALGYRVRRLNGKFDFVWMYCGRFAKGNEDNYETEADKKNAQTNTVKGEFYQREKMDKVDGKDVHLYELRVDESNLATEDTGAAAAIKAWFGMVQEYAATVGG